MLNAIHHHCRRRRSRFTIVPINHVRRNSGTHTLTNRAQYHYWRNRHKKCTKSTKAKRNKVLFNDARAYNWYSCVIRQIDLFLAPPRNDAFHWKSGERPRAVLRINKFTHNFWFPFSLQKNTQKDQFTSMRHVFISPLELCKHWRRRLFQSEWVANTCFQISKRAPNILLFIIIFSRRQKKSTKSTLSNSNQWCRWNLYEAISGERKKNWADCSCVARDKWSQIYYYLFVFIAYSGFAMVVLYAHFCSAFPQFESIYPYVGTSTCCECYFHFSIRSIGE